MSRTKTIEKIAREMCWLGFAHADARAGKTKASYWKSLPESTRQNYRSDAINFAYWVGKINFDLLNELTIRPPRTQATEE